MRFAISTLMIGICVAGLITGCSNKNSSEKNKDITIENCDSIPDIIKSFVRSVKNGNKAQFSSLISYPLQRPYPLKDIASKDEMIAYYDILIDDSISNVITTSKPENWKEYGWRGWSLDGGNYVWADDNIYDMPYVSRREQQMIDSLTLLETSSLPLGLRNGWKPILTMKQGNNGKIYRIDIRTEGKQKGGHHYRLAIYDSRNNLKNMPSQLLDGVMEAEGTSGNLLYIFHDATGTEYTIQPDSPETGTPMLTLPNDSTIELSKAYWYNLVN